MNVGLLWVPVSVYQMLRGSLVLFVGLFSVIFLHRKLPLEQWLSLFVVMLGIAIVGLSNAISTPTGGEEGAHHEDTTKAILGAALVLFAQIFTASQFVVEEKIMTRYSLAPLVSYTFSCSPRFLHWSFGSGELMGIYVRINRKQSASRASLDLSPRALACRFYFSYLVEVLHRHHITNIKATKVISIYQMVLKKLLVIQKFLLHQYLLHFQLHFLILLV